MLVDDQDTKAGKARLSLPAAITRMSRGLRWFLLSAILTAASLAALQALGARIEQLVGHPPFDLQTPLDVDTMLTQAPLYTNEALVTYGVFLTVDTLFPLSAALLLCLVLARSISTFQRLSGRRVRESWLVVVPLVGAVLDWTENIFFTLALVDTSSIALWATVAVAVKAAKVATSVILISSVTLGFAAVVGVWWTIARLRRRN